MDFQSTSQSAGVAGGYTLAELMMALAIGSILLSIAIPGYQWLSARTTVSSSVNLFLTHLHQARAEAVTRERVVALCPSDNGSSCHDDYRLWANGYIVFVDNDRDKQRSANEKLISYNQSKSRQITISSSSNSRLVLAYLPTGRAWVSNTTIRFCIKDHNESNRAVIISTTGRPRLSRTLANGRSILCADG